MEKQSLPAIGLSLERDTERTPDTTHFHLFRNTTLIASFSKRRKAEQAYREAIEASGYRPPVVEHTNPDGLSAVQRARQLRR